MIGTMHASRWVCPIVVAMAAVAAAQVPLNKDPRHRVVFENAELRILDVNVPVGGSTQNHLHDRDIVTVSMSAGTETRVESPGQPSSVRPPRPLGDSVIAEYTGKTGSHKVDNLGKSPYQLFAVENLRASGWSSPAALASQSATLLTEGRAFRVYDVRLARGKHQVSHTHSATTIVVLLAGKVMSDAPDAQAKAYAPAAVGLKQLDGLGQWLLVPKGDSHHVVRLGNEDARVVEIEVR
jgi:quercetin dioxygenase-like cupin family protein